MNKFQQYLDQLSHWPKSRFYYRADVRSTYFWKLKEGQRYASADLIHRIWKATEGEVDLPSVIEWFGERRTEGMYREIMAIEQYHQRLQDS